MAKEVFVVKLALLSDTTGSREAMSEKLAALLPTNFAKAVHAKKEALQRELEECLPGLEHALGKMNALDKRDMQEVRCFHNPPRCVKDVMKMVCILLEVKPIRVKAERDGGLTDDYWPPALKLLAGGQILGMMFDYDKDNIPDDVVEKVRLMLEMDHCHPYAVMRCSVVAEAFLHWARAMVGYNDVASRLQPGKEQFRMLEQSLAEHVKKMENVISLANTLSGVVDDGHRASAECLVKAWKCVFAALSLPTDASLLRKREQAVRFALAPRCMTLEVSTITGETHQFEMEKTARVRNVKLAIESGVQIPAMCQVLSSDSQVLHDNDVIGEHCANGATVCVTITVSREPIWHAIATSTCQGGSWKDALNALSVLVGDEFERDVVDFASKHAGLRFAVTEFMRVVRALIDVIKAGADGRLKEGGSINIRHSAARFVEMCNNSSAVRQMLAVFEHLVRRGDECAKNMVEVCIASPDVSVSKLAMEIIYGVDLALLHQSLLKGLQDSSRARRLRTLDVLLWFSKRTEDAETQSKADEHMPDIDLKPQFDDRSFDNLVFVVATKKDSEEWNKAFSLLSQLGERRNQLVRSLIRHASDGSEPALRALHRLDISGVEADEIPKVLLACLLKADETLRLPAMQLSRKLDLDHHPCVTQGLIQIMKNKPTENDVTFAMPRLSAAMVQAANSNDDALIKDFNRFLANGIHDRNVNVRHTCIAALEVLPSPLWSKDITDGLRQVAEADWPHVKSLARKAIGRMDC
eukprot:TRINITY_DN15331_c0_g1_i1.p1 TRINITY_DN15331_c0_g1~~TRINITY_DN15331_c0_g1_i1.p1  ORF type:complete len:860 (+),score=116.02 TRINITY_DN15331_c0_g1_i1:324-2582(+)